MRCKCNAIFPVTISLVITLLLWLASSITALVTEHIVWYIILSVVTFLMIGQIAGMIYLIDEEAGSCFKTNKPVSSIPETKPDIDI